MPLPSHIFDGRASSQRLPPREGAARPPEDDAAAHFPRQDALAVPIGPAHTRARHRASHGGRERAWRTAEACASYRSFDADGAVRTRAPCHAPGSHASTECFGHLFSSAPGRTPVTWASPCRAREREAPDPAAVGKVGRARARAAVGSSPPPSLRCQCALCVVKA